MEQPFFSIGVTTYKRPVLLREALRSILQQGFADYEVLVGNDDPDSPLSADRLGIEDRRVRLINHPSNLREVRNMNALLETAQGRYFTWLADDDLYAPRFLEQVHEALVRFSFPPCVFTSYVVGARPPGDGEPWAGMGVGARVLSGREFVREYLARSLNVLGCYGMFDLSRLRSMGGMDDLGDGFTLYSDNLLAIKSGFLERIVYLDDPLILFRRHEGSNSWGNPRLGAYRIAQENLLTAALVILTDARLHEDLRLNITGLLRWCLADFAGVARRAGVLPTGEVVKYVRLVRRYLHLLKGSDAYWPTLGVVLKTGLGVWRDIAGRRLTGGSTDGRHAGGMLPAVDTRRCEESRRDAAVRSQLPR